MPTLNSIPTFQLQAQQNIVNARDKQIPTLNSIHTFQLQTQQNSKCKP